MLLRRELCVTSDSVSITPRDRKLTTVRVLEWYQVEEFQQPQNHSFDRLFDVSKLQKGLNFVALNGSTGNIEDSQSFDVATSDEKLITWLRHVSFELFVMRNNSFRSLPSTSILLGVSFGDIAERVSVDARRALEIYGARKVEKWRGNPRIPREIFIFIT